MLQTLAYIIELCVCARACVCARVCVCVRVRACVCVSFNQGTLCLEHEAEFSGFETGADVDLYMFAVFRCNSVICHDRI